MLRSFCPIVGQQMLWLGENDLAYQFSVTRFGEISSLYQKFTNLWQMFDGSFLI